MKRISLLMVGFFTMMLTLYSVAEISPKEINFLPDKLAESPPAAAIIIIDTNINCVPSDTDVCVGELVTYSATLNPSVQYFWNVTGGTAPPSAASPPTSTNTYPVTWGSVGSGTVTLIVKDNAGNTIKTCQWNVTIHPLPDPEIISSFSPTCDRPRSPVHDKPDTSDCLLACDSSTIVYLHSVKSREHLFMDGIW